MSLIISLIVGLIAGALAGQFVRGGGFGLLWNIVIGLIGGAIGGLLFNFFGLDPDGTNILGSIVISFVGAVILLVIVRAISGSGQRM